MVSPLSGAAVGSEANKSAMASWDDAVREVRPLRQKWAGRPSVQWSSTRRAVTIFSLLEATKLEAVYLDGQGLE